MHTSQSTQKQQHTEYKKSIHMTSQKNYISSLCFLLCSSVDPRRKKVPFETTTKSSRRKIYLNCSLTYFFTFSLFSHYFPREKRRKIHRLWSFVDPVTCRCCCDSSKRKIVKHAVPAVIIFLLFLHNQDKLFKIHKFFMMLILFACQ